jgi:pyridoxamine 5'-phosphate oxidase
MEKPERSCAPLGRDPERTRAVLLNMTNDPGMKHPSQLTFSDFPDAREPFAPFEAWMAEAKASEPRDPDAMALATVDADGMPNVRMVLLKGWGPDGLVFYTNRESAKGRELDAQGKAALTLYWKSLSRQVRMRGPVQPVTGAESDAYFSSRPRGAQIGAWASRQSRPLSPRPCRKRAIPAPSTCCIRPIQDRGRRGAQRLQNLSPGPVYPIRDMEKPERSCAPARRDPE